MNMQKLHKLAVFCTVVINIPIVFGDINDDGLNEILNHNKQKLNGFTYDILGKYELYEIKEDRFKEAKDLFVQYLAKKAIKINNAVPSVKKTSHRNYKCVNYFWGCSEGKKCGIRFFYNGTIHLGEFTADNNNKNTFLKKIMSKIIDCIDGWRYDPKKKGIWDEIKKQSLLNKASQTMNTAHKSFTEHSKKMVSNTLSVVNNGINDIYNKTNRVLNTANTLIEVVNGVYKGFNSVQETNDTNNNTGNNEILNEEHQNQNQNTGSNQRYNNERHDVTTEKKGFIVGKLIKDVTNTMYNPNVMQATSNLVRTYNNTFGDLSVEDRINSITTGMKIYGICCRCRW